MLFLGVKMWLKSKSYNGNNMAAPYFQMDGRMDGRNCTNINFLVSCKDQVVFLKSLDASKVIKMVETLTLMLENVVMEVGAQNVVQIIADNATTYVAAGRILQEKHNTLFWSPCATHVIDLLLEDIGKLDWVKPVVEEARKITKYICNHPWVLCLMRDYIEDKELVRPAVTRFATIFLTLQSVLHHKNPLRQIFVCPKCLQSSYSKVDGQSVARIVFDIHFFDRATKIVEVVKPLVRVLRLVDGEQTPMGSLYEAMAKAKGAVRNKYRVESLKFQPIWDIIDRRWSNQLHQPIHAAGYFLNPCYRFSPSYADPNGEVMEGFSECMQRMVPEIAVRNLIVAEMEVYQNATGKLFSSTLAKRGKHTQSPGTILGIWNLSHA